MRSSGVGGNSILGSELGKTADGAADGVMVSSSRVVVAASGSVIVGVAVVLGRSASGMELWVRRKEKPEATEIAVGVGVVMVSESEVIVGEATGELEGKSMVEPLPETVPEAEEESVGPEGSAEVGPEGS